MFVVRPVTVLHVVVVHGPLACVVLGRTLPHVGHHLVEVPSLQHCSIAIPHLSPRLYLIVAVLHSGAGLGAEEERFSDGVDEVVL